MRALARALAAIPAPALALGSRGAARESVRGAVRGAGSGSGRGPARGPALARPRVESRRAGSFRRHRLVPNRGSSSRRLGEHDLAASLHEAPGGEADRPDLVVRGVHAAERDALPPDGRHGRDVGGGRRHARKPLDQPRVLRLQGARRRGAERTVVSPVPLAARAGAYGDQVRAEVAYLARDALLYPVSQGGEQHDGGHPDDDAEHREDRAPPVDQQP